MKRNKRTADSVVSPSQKRTIKPKEGRLNEITNLKPKEVTPPKKKTIKVD